jgi:hypothetical protein
LTTALKLILILGGFFLTYGPFYRIETNEVARLQVQSKEIWGRARRNIYQGINASVKAYTEWNAGEGAKGVKFTTEVPPDPDSFAPPGQVQWSGNRPGVYPKGDYVIIQVLEIDYYP